MGRVIAVVGVALGLLAAGAAAPPARAQDAATIARNLAENVLGRDLVRTSRLSSDGRSLEMVWASATFKPTNPLPQTRELLRVEAEFASASIFRVLTGVRDLQFEIVLGKRSLCTGAASRDRPFRITYPKDLGG